MALRIRGGRTLQADGTSFSPADIHIERGRIAKTTPPDPTGASTTDVNADDLLVVPGLIDLQVNGGWGHDLTRAPEHVWKVGAELAAAGVTSWMPTLVSASLDQMQDALDVLRAGPPEGWHGAEPLGWHFEGPWLNPDRRGAHPLSSMLAPPSGVDLARHAHLVTVAPELPGAHEFIESLAEAGVIVSVGHSGATSEQVAAALDRGATMGTHLFNAMSGLHHRDPGVAAGLLDDARAWIGLIVDGHHVAPELVRLAWAVAGDRIVLVSDAMAAAGLGDTVSSLGEQEVTVADGAARLDDGTLAGSVISIIDAVRNLCEFVGCDPAEAIRAASVAPARAMRLATKGRLAAGADGDVVLLDDDLHVAATFVGGELAFASTEFLDRQDVSWK